MSKPIAIDLFCGLFGWGEVLAEEGYDVIGYDIADMCAEVGRLKPRGCSLMIQDVRTLHGSALKDASLIVASPPCTEYSWMAMPWSRAKQVARALRGTDDFPAGYRGSRTIGDLTALFDACFRIQREASEAAGRHIPLVVENVRGAQDWVGTAEANYGSFYLWGDVLGAQAVLAGIGTAKRIRLLPDGQKPRKFNPDRRDHPTKKSGGSWFTIDHKGQKESANNPVSVPRGGYKSTGLNWSDLTKRGQDFTRVAGQQAAEGRKGTGADAAWFDGNLCALPSKSPRRREASAMIAKIPPALSRLIARTYKP